MTVDVLESKKTRISDLTRVFKANLREKRYSLDRFQAAITQDEDVHTHILINLGKPLSRLHYIFLADPQPYAILLPNFKPSRRFTHSRPLHVDSRALH